MRIGGAALRPPWKAGPAGEDEPESAGVRPGRKKASASGVRAWLTVDAAGEARVVEAGRHSVMRRTGLPARDLRILDPQLSYPSTVLGRERAIVVNLEHIKAIITAHEEGGVGSSEDWTNVCDLGEPKSRTASPPQGSDDLEYPGSLHVESETDEKEKREEISSNGPRDLPFEFIALEACLEAACSCLENEATTLEKEAHPALDKLTSKISTLNLERVRQIKSRLVTITGRVQKWDVHGTLGWSTIPCVRMGYHPMSHQHRSILIGISWDISCPKSGWQRIPFHWKIGNSG
ncbi:putative magnesium transporter MRS2-3 [Cocos nucifera]|uniref:Magnesium transporter n=1 Tax=Cocos nucifera TaxID=13894 RepID=A0A8K0IVY8_COCNU|nr:putative magnesium transporter MRS2-3 [Cocos nucifera]